MESNNVDGTFQKSDDKAEAVMPRLDSVQQNAKKFQKGDESAELAMPRLASAQRNMPETHEAGQAGEEVQSVDNLTVVEGKAEENVGEINGSCTLSKNIPSATDIPNNWESEALLAANVDMPPKTSAKDDLVFKESFSPAVGSAVVEPPEAQGDKPSDPSLEDVSSEMYSSDSSDSDSEADEQFQRAANDSSQPQNNPLMDAFPGRAVFLELDSAKDSRTLMLVIHIGAVAAALREPATKKPFCI